jgi:hypothetical protein
MVGTAAWLIGLIFVGPPVPPSTPGNTSRVDCVAREHIPEHVRPLDCALATAVGSGLSRSAAFRDIVKHIAALNGIVWLKASMVVRPDIGEFYGGLMHRLTPMGAHRGMFILVAPGRGDETVVTLAHELQHFVEVLESRASTEAEIDALFQRIGTPVAPGTTETAAAIQFARIVRLELARHR